MEHKILVEKYRPHKIADCILPAGLKQTFSDIVASGVIPNMMFNGKKGIGKTTVARALCEELDHDYILVNASKDGNIDTLRVKVQSFASTMSFNGNRKVVIFDEADYLNAQSTQPALRAFMEEFALNVSFIFTCNKKARIIEELHSRCAVIEFVIPAKEKPAIAKAFFNRVVNICQLEKVEADKKVLQELVMKYFPDFRRTLNELQRHSVGGTISPEILDGVKDLTLGELMGFIKAKDFAGVRKWVALNANDIDQLFRKVYDAAYDVFEKDSIPQLVVLLGQYQYQAAFVQDHEINTMAFLTEVMSSCEAKG